jgi:hypothetical protein
MTKQKTAVAVDVLLDDVNYKSIKDLGYSVAKKSDAAKLDGKYAVEHMAGFPDSITKENRDEFYDGARLRASELKNYRAVEYAVVDGNYIPVDQLSGELPAERYIVSVASVFSYSQQQFGAMKSESPQLYAIVQAIRKKVNSYCSNALGELKRSARTYLKDKNPESKTRAATLAYVAYLEKILDEMVTRCKTAESRGNDDTADLESLKSAIVAFKTKYKPFN